MKPRKCYWYFTFSLFVIIILCTGCGNAQTRDNPSVGNTDPSQPQDITPLQTTEPISEEILPEPDNDTVYTETSLLIISKVVEVTNDNIDTSSLNWEKYSQWECSNFIAYKTGISIGSAMGAFVYQFGKIGVTGAYVPTYPGTTVILTAEDGTVIYMKPPENRYAKYFLVAR